MSSARLAFCSTSSTAMPVSRLTSPRRSNTSWVTSGARPSDGSSSRISRGRDMSARAIASICCSPPLMLPGLLVAPLAEPREHREPAFDVGVDVAVLAACSAPMRRFSSTVRSVIVPRPWGTWAMPGRDDLVGVLAQRSTGRRSVTAPRAGIIPQIARSVVVLPAPLAPRIDDRPRLRRRRSRCRRAPHQPVAGRAGP